MLGKPAQQATDARQNIDECFHGAIKTATPRPDKAQSAEREDDKIADHKFYPGMCGLRFKISGDASC